MDQIMTAKLAHWEMEEEMGIMAAEFPAWHKRVRCSNGIADALPGVPGHQFKCRNVSISLHALFIGLFPEDGFVLFHSYGRPGMP